jgi:hypothetical protein
VRFPRPDGTFYIQADIYQCQGCTVMFGDKDVLMKLKGTIARTGSAQDTPVMKDNGFLALPTLRL